MISVDNIPDSALVSMHDDTSKLVNKWLEDTRGFPITLQLARLGLMIIGRIKSWYVTGYEDGYEAAIKERGEK